jgi:SAM-dependent methyltransferase
MLSSDDSERARLYALRDLEGTDRLAFRAVAEGRWLAGRRVLDLGCGAGRSSRFLRDLGNEVVGIDASGEMLNEARAADPDGTYLRHDATRPLPFAEAAFDAFFSSWMLLELGERGAVAATLAEAARVTRPGGIGVVIVNSEAFYRGDWLSCQVDYPENAAPLASGQRVRARLVPEGVEVSDFFWSEADYGRAFEEAGLELVETQRPLGREDDGVEWRDELHLGPYLVFRLLKPEAQA